jgi:GH18 family chitinase
VPLQPFLTNGKYLISYDDEDSTIAKAKFAKEKNMGGIYL